MIFDDVSVLKYIFALFSMLTLSYCVKLNILCCLSDFYIFKAKTCKNVFFAVFIDFNVFRASSAMDAPTP